MQLQVITRGQSDTRNKLKVFVYTMLPEASVRSAAEWILEKKNAAVYYPADFAAGSGRLSGEVLREMHLVLFLVDGRKLLENGQEFAAAADAVRKMHIPFIPVLMRESLAPASYDDVNRIFGKVQLLEPYSPRGEDRLAFRDMLQRALDIYLRDTRSGYDVGQTEFRYDLDAQTVRSIYGNFSLLGFISYRKKNGACIPRLLRAISADPRHVDIGFWFDDFLVPGENYAGSILDALEAADFVLLLVTPDIFTPGNYVLTVEYPQAVRFGKRIIGVEAEPCDHLLLAELYPDLCGLFTMEDFCRPGSAAEALLLSMRAERAHAAPDLYLLGRAYDEGIGTLRDTEKAVSLFEQAAERQSVDAMERLIFLYENGYGVPADREKAGKWRRQIVRTEKAMLSSGQVWIRQKLIRELWALGDSLMEEYRFEEALDAYRDMVGHMEEAFAEGNPAFRRYNRSRLVYGCNKIANLFMETGRPRQADPYLRRALQTGMEDEEISGRAGGGLDLAETWYLCAKRARQDGDIREARRCLDKAAAFADAAAPVPGQPGMMADILEEKMQLHLQEGRLQEALAAAASMRSMGEKYVTEFRRHKGWDLIYRAYLGEAGILQRAGDTAGAAEAYERGLQAAEKLLERERTPGTCWKLAGCAFELGKLCYGAKRYDLAGRYLKTAGENLPSEFRSIHELETAAELYALLGNLAWMEKDYGEARRAFLQGKTFREAVFEAAPSDQAKLNMASIWYKIASADPDTDDEESMREALSLYAELEEKYPGNAQISNLAEKARRYIAGAKERRERSARFRGQIRSFAAGMFRTLDALEEAGIRLSPETSNASAVSDDVCAFMLSLPGSPERFSEEMAEVLNLALRRRDTRMSYLFYMSPAGGAPYAPGDTAPSVRKLVQFERQMYAASPYDLLEGITIQARLLYYYLGEWIAELSGPDSGAREKWARLMREMDGYIKSRLPVQY